ncbi:MAG: DUF1308 domain-containing protein [Verrucomicrobiaceae bacterium]|nr:MAG: DUF1308 domain-containing protein [Verrucomicrobiaceae bacterium]
MVTSAASGVSRGSSLLSKNVINIDASTASTFVSEGSFMRHQLKALVSGKKMVMTETALGEVQNMMQKAGPKEMARYQRFLERISIIPDNPSARALGLKVTKSVGANDIRIFGTADEIGATTMTGDAKFLRGSSAQGVDFDAILHPSVPLTGQ